MRSIRQFKWNKGVNYILVILLTLGMIIIPTELVNADVNTTSKGVFNPTVIVRVSEDEILTYFWRAGTSVKLTIDDPANGVSVDYSDTLPVIGGSNLTEDVLFKINDFDLAPGQLISLTDGISTDTVQLSPVHITNISNNIYGIANPDTTIQAKFRTDTRNVSFRTTARPNGTWQILVESFYWDVVRQGKLTLSIWDADKDVVEYTQPYKKPYFEVNLTSNSIEGWDWLAEKTITWAISDPVTGAEQDLTGSMKMTGTNYYPHFVADLDSFKLAPGQVITLTDGTTLKTHVVQNLAITDVNLDLDRFSGSSNTSDDVYSWIIGSNGRVFKRTSAVINGLWLSNFSSPGDQSQELGIYNITDSTQLFSKQVDEDGDATVVTQIAAENLPPIARAGDNVTAEKGATISFDGSASSDPEGKPLNFEWDLDNDGVFDDAFGVYPTAVFADEGTYPISLRVKDEDGLTSIDSLSVTIQSEAQTINLPPVAEAGADIEADQGATITFDGSRSVDPEGKPLSFDWDFDHDGLFDDATGMNPAQIFRENGSYLVSLRVTDSGTLTATDIINVTILQVAPIIGDIIVPSTPQLVNIDQSFEATIEYPGNVTNFSHLWEWNNGSHSGGPIIGRKIYGHIPYYSPGIYTVKLILTDQNGATYEKNSDEFVVIAPSAASVFGSGWINSPAGSTLSAPMVTGKVYFDFNTSYRRSSASVPSGKMNIFVKGQYFKFVSTSYSWLVIKGKTSHVEGSGTVNGKGDFGFLVTIQDGSWYKRNSDMLRIKIWNKATGEVIYDTQPGAADNTLATTPVNGLIFTINK